MCGILVSFHSGDKTVDPDTFRSLLDTLSHRGPDDSGIWSDSGGQITLGHRRLSILDLSPLGHQPMHSHDGRWTIVYNGEIYNWQELRENLESAGVSFRSHTDTEVLLEGIALWGLEAILRKCVGMFALAVWDRVEHRLHIARDRFGEKPLYYAWKNGAWWVTSELKALAKIPGYNWELDKEAIGLFLRYKYIPEPFSIYREARKLLPGCFAELKSDGTIDQRAYWKFSDVVEQGRTNPFSGTEEDAADELERQLKRAIQFQRVADVPVGAFLSGGIDSSTVVALMQAQGGDPVRTFSIGFDESDYDESRYAAAVAQHLGTTHTELRVTPAEAMAVIPELASIYDEPFGDSSAIPTILVSRLTREQVTVALSGDAGDELAGGYNRYHQLNELWRQIESYPKWTRSCLSALYSVGRKTCSQLGCERVMQKFAWRERFAKSRSMQELYYNIVTQYCNLDSLLLDPPVAFPFPKVFPVDSLYHYGMACDTVEYLPGDILVKVDRAAMSCSLESRIPILDHRLAEWMWTLPESYKIDDRNTKKSFKGRAGQACPAIFDRETENGFWCSCGRMDPRTAA
ncbi:MAG: asparagine synthase (glutamine-hydrolyzing) [bacterium]